MSLTKVTGNLTKELPITIGIMAMGDVLDNDEKIGKYVTVEAFSLPTSLTGSRAHAETAATAETVLSVQKNNVEIGTITFAAAGTTGTFASASGASFAVGDRLTVVGPASADATLAGISISLYGTRT